MMTEDFKKDVNNSLKEIQENTGKQVERLKEETQNPLKNYKQVKELNKIIKDIKMEKETIKKHPKGRQPGRKKT